MTTSRIAPGEKPLIQKALSWLVTIAIPVVLVLLAVRLLLNPWYLEFEYRTPGFPEDRYGFNQAERLYWSKITLDYLVNNEGIDFLADLRFPEGQLIPQPSCSFVDDCSRVYNDRELQHMLDVKNVVQIANVVLWVSLAALLVVGLVAWRSDWINYFWKSVGRGGWLTVAIGVSLLLFVLLAFGIIFVWFHEIFFDPGTWTFFYSDTLIRLFPERFWRDTFLIAAGLPMVAGFALGYFLGRK